MLMLLRKFRRIVDEPIVTSGFRSGGSFRREIDGRLDENVRKGKGDDGNVLLRWRKRQLRLRYLRLRLRNRRRDTGNVDHRAHARVHGRRDEDASVFTPTVIGPESAAH